MKRNDFQRAAIRTAPPAPNLDKARLEEALASRPQEPSELSEAVPSALAAAASSPAAKLMMAAVGVAFLVGGAAWLDRPAAPPPASAPRTFVESGSQIMEIEGAEPKDAFELLRSISALPLPFYAKDALAKEAMDGSVRFHIVSVRTENGGKAPVVVKIGGVEIRTVLTAVPLLLPVPADALRPLEMTGPAELALDVVLTAKGGDIQAVLSHGRPISFQAR